MFDFRDGELAPPRPAHHLHRSLRRLFSNEALRPRCIGEVHCPPDSGRKCCYRFRPTPRLQVSIVDFVSPESVECPKRGRLRNGQDRIEPCFRSIAEDAFCVGPENVA